MKTTEITFYTAPSTWIHGEQTTPAQNAYDRIAGLTLYNQTMWEERSRLPRMNDYLQTDTKATTYRLPTKMAEDMADYFYDFYVAPTCLYNLSNIRTSWDERSNCHRFGTTILTGRPQSFYDSYDISTQIACKNRLQTVPIAQPMGELAIINVTTENNRVDAAHTMVSLGDGNYIQSVALGGNLGISSLKSMLVDHRVRWPQYEYGVRYSETGDRQLTGTSHFSNHLYKIAPKKIRLME